ncbi:MAG: ABC transporter substrate-binding protein [Desulfurococcaceae archaeon]
MSSSISKVTLILVVVTLIVGILVGYGIGLVTVSPVKETVTETRYITITQTPTQTPTVTPPGRVKITISIGWTGKEREPFDAAVNEYLRRNPNVEIEYVVYRAEDLAAILPAQLEAKRYPAEIMITPWSWFILELAKKGHLEDLSTYLPINEFLPDYVQLVTYEGKVYGIPIGLYFKELYWYRKSFFQAHGLTKPRTWDEFVTLLDNLKSILGPKKAIIVGDGMGWPASDIVESFILAFGGAELHSGLTKGTIKFNDPQVQAIFRDELVPLIRAGYFSEPVEWTAAKEYWWAKEYGIYPLGSFLLPMLDDPDDADFFILPGKPDMIGNVDFLFVPKYIPPEIKPIVMDFLKFLATTGQEIMASYPAGRVPTWTKADPEKVYPIFRELYQMAVTGQIKFVPDMDDTIGGDWQRLFWDYCKTLFIDPNIWSEMLETLTQQHPKR